MILKIIKIVSVVREKCLLGCKIEMVCEMFENLLEETFIRILERYNKVKSNKIYKKI